MALTDFSESSGERNIERDGQLLLTDFSSDQWSRILEFYYQEADRREKKIKGERRTYSERTRAQTRPGYCTVTASTV